MRKTAWIYGTVLCAFALSACSDDGGTGGTGGTSTSSTVRGVVSSNGGSGEALAGASVSVFGTSISTTTDDAGRFTLENVPNGDAFFVTVAEGHWGIVDYWVVPDETQIGVTLGAIPDDDIASVAGTLGRTIDPATGAVDITFYEGAVGGETGTIVDATTDPAFTFSLTGVPIEQPGVIADPDGYGELVYTGIDPATGPVSVTVSGVGGVTVCGVNESPGTTYPILPKSLTTVYAFCDPVQ